MQTFDSFESAPDAIDWPSHQLLDQIINELRAASMSQHSCVLVSRRAGSAQLTTATINI
jgi:hypothetical protein